MLKATINIYELGELKDSARQIAIDEHAAFLQMLGNEVENESGQLVTTYDEPTEEEVIESIEANSYMFFCGWDISLPNALCGESRKGGNHRIRIQK